MKPLFDIHESRRASLLELCRIESGAILSKTLVNTDAVKFVLFAMDAGQELSEHQTPMLATVHLLDGRMRFEIDGESHDMAPGDWVLIPPGRPHAVRADEPCRFLLTMARAEGA